MTTPYVNACANALQAKQRLWASHCRAQGNTHNGKTTTCIWMFAAFRHLYGDAARQDCGTCPCMKEGPPRAASPTPSRLHMPRMHATKNVKQSRRQTATRKRACQCCSCCSGNAAAQTRVHTPGAGGAHSPGACPAALSCPRPCHTHPSALPLTTMCKAANRTPTHHTRHMSPDPPRNLCSATTLSPCVSFTTLSHRILT